MLLVLVVTIEIRWRHVFRHGDGLWVYRGTNFLHDSVEAVVVVSCVLDDPDAAVGLVDAVGSVDDVPVPDFVLGFDISCVGIVHAVVERVLGMGLEEAKGMQIILFNACGLDYWGYSLKIQGKDLRAVGTLVVHMADTGSILTLNTLP